MSATNSLFSLFVFSAAERLMGRDIRAKRDMLQVWEKEEAAKRKKRVAKELASTVAYAGERVPYYRELFRRIRFNPASLEIDIQFLKDIPYLTKDVILGSYDQFISEDFNRSELIVRKTSGSTGITTPFLYSPDELDWTSAATVFLNAKIGRNVSQREIHLSSKPSDPIATRERFKEALKCFALNRVNVQLGDLNADDLASSWETIKAAKPFMIYGLPSIFKNILRNSATQTGDKMPIKYFVSSGETLDEQSLRYIESRGINVVNRYGNAEFGVIAQSLDRPLRLGFIDGLVFPESLELQTDINEIVLTTLRNRAMPLIRYRTGDLGTVSNNQDGTFDLAAIQGRIHESVDFGSTKYMTSFFRDLLHSKFAIHDFQILQCGDKVGFNVVTDNPESLGAINTELNRIAGRTVEVKRVRLTDLVRQGPQKKFSYLIKT